MNTSNKSCEPMDVDLSGSSASKMDISYNKDNDEHAFIRSEPDCDPIFIKTEPDDIILLENDRLNFCNSVETSPRKSVGSEIKREHGGNVKKHQIKINRREKERKQSPIDIRIKLLLFSLFLICVSVVSHIIINFKCSDELDMKYLEETLLKNIYGQPKAVDAIIETLALNVSSKIMFFYGGTGVGKTFTSSLIFDKLGKSSNIYHYTMPSFATTFSADFMLGLTVCKTCTMIVDDLTANDMHIKAHVNDVIAKSENLGKNITIILIYNCDNVTEDFIKQCDRTFYKELKESFIDVNAVKKFIKFNPLTEEHLGKCIQKEFGNRQVNKLDMENILKNFNVSLDGCKGVYTKIKFMNIV